MLKGGGAVEDQDGYEIGRSTSKSHFGRRPSPGGM
jgi:hypothetical protein